MQKINQEKAALEKSVFDYNKIHQNCLDAEVMLEMAVEESDETLFKELQTNLKTIATELESLEVQSLLSGRLDHSGAFLSVNSGAGGTEACDWAEMLFRMYTRFCEDESYQVEVESINQGDEAGIKSVTISIDGPFAFGRLKAETGVHRLVRISPYDSNARRHTSFASVLVWPQVEDEVEVEIRPEDLRVDTYRASGAGGQHINRTDSAVRLTHEPTGIVIACQTQRSQHANKDRAMKMLKAALYEIEVKKLNKDKEDIESQKKANEWGSQIRSYVLHPYQLVKDHRTGWETGNPSAVLDGDLGEAISSFLKSQAEDKVKP